MRVQAAFADDNASMRDREVIRIDCASDAMGIAAALRRAFAEPRDEVCAPDFEDLLLKLN